MLKKLRIKFICIFMVTVTVMLSVILGTVITLTHKNIEQQNISAMRDIAMPPKPHNKPEKEFEHIPKPHFSLLITPEGEFIAEDNGMFDLSDEEYLNSLFEYAESRDEETGIVPDTSLRYFRNRTPMGNSYIFTDVSAEANMLESLYRTCIIIGASALLLFFVISIFLAKWAVKPVEEAWDKQKQFIADASHELKTPLTVITTNAELMKSESSEESKAKFTDNILTMSKQMRGLVESMLEIARLDNGSVRKEFAVFNLSETISDAILPFEALFFEKEQIFTSEIEPDINMNGNAEQIKQVIDILLDNANKYASEKSGIKLILKKQGRNQCRLSVSNEGETIPEDELKNIFKRFYRGDKTRQMNNSYGLGLSIAESIVTEHSGKIFAESKNGVNIFTAQFHTT
ncbi:MAG: HAMP domain-containing histidine kinase [Clostridia bacterium]|nr:HAMP domain-containing histidine kinase [Clostridia bacterium]